MVPCFRGVVHDLGRRGRAVYTESMHARAAPCASRPTTPQALVQRFIVMGGLVPTIHVFLARIRQSRGWPSQARP